MQMRAPENIKRDLEWACECVLQQAWNLLSDPRSYKALEVASRCARGLATEEELQRTLQGAKEVSHEIARQFRGSGRWHAAEAAVFLAKNDPEQARDHAAAAWASDHAAETPQNQDAIMALEARKAEAKREQIHIRDRLSLSSVRPTEKPAKRKKPRD
jgi:hypothetical protein